MQQSLFIASDEPQQPISSGLTKRTLAEARDFTVAEFYFDADIIAGGHSHPTDEAGYVVAGRFEIQLGDEARIVGPGDAYTLPAGVEHNVRCLESGSYLVVKLVQNNR